MTSLTELNWGILEVFYLIIIFAVGFLSTFLIIPRLIKYMKKKGNVGIDIHKNSKPEVAESGGISIVIGASLTSILLMIFFPIFIKEILIFLLTIILAGIIGFIDDLRKLKSRYKIGLTIFTGGIIFFANYIGFIHITSPTIPFIGKTRLTIIYPLLIPIIVAVFANTVNMLEGYNGEGSGTVLIAACFLFVCALIWDSAEAMLFTLILIAVIIPFFIYNKYPAKTFPGDVGTLTMGVMIACIALFGSLEVAVFCALFLHILNSFYVIYSVKGFIESSKIQKSKDDIILLKNDKIKASDQKGAALTLPRLILAKGSLTEKELVINIYIISIICGFLSIVAVLFMQFSKGALNVIIIIISIFILGVPFFLLFYRFHRIRGIVFIMLLLLVVSAVFLILIDIYIMTLKIADIDLFIIKIPVNILFSILLYIPILILWYYITIKYFWIQINKMKKMEDV